MSPVPCPTGKAPQDARLIETHTAYVLLVGDTVVKWKKPVDLGFLNFSTVEARAAACEAEVSLNRRLAPDVYDGCATVLGPQGEVREHLVLMRRLPDDLRLAALVEEGRSVAQPLMDLARLLADFHAACPVAPDGEAVAGLDRLQELWDLGLIALADVPATVIDRTELAQARQLVGSFLMGRGRLLGERINSGRVRDGHGDLLADDVFCLPDGPRVLDCLEFDPALRFGDVLSDLASLASDLERIGATDDAALFLQAYANASGDHPPATLTHLYLAYRAQVRAKVACLRAEQTSDPSIRRAQLGSARRLCRSMLRHLERTRVRLVLIGGLPGSGKSTVAEQVAQQEGLEVLSSDLFRREALDDLCVDPSGTYLPANVEVIYDRLLVRAEELLQRGIGVVIDASWGDGDRRLRARQVAARTGADLVELQCRAPDDLAAARIAARPPDHPSDADMEVRRTLTTLASPWPEATALDTTRSVADTVAVAVDAVHARRTAVPAELPFDRPWRDLRP